MFGIFYCFIFVFTVFHVCLSQILDEPVDFDYQAIVPRVVNGWAAKKGDVPYQVAFKSIYSQYRNQYVTFCGGVIISPTKLLSAAHCFDDKKSGCQKCWGHSVKLRKRRLFQTFAVAGNLENIAHYSPLDSSDGGQWRRLSEVFYPRRYNFPEHDIAIAFTSSQFVFNDNVGPIPISSHFADYSGQCLVSGYGRISEQLHSDKLLLANLEIIPWHQCNRIHLRNMHHFVCTSSRVADVNKGDSGGPLVCKGTGDPNERDKGILIGIVSGHRVGAGSFFTRVSSYHTYIKNKAFSIYRSKSDR